METRYWQRTWFASLPSTAEFVAGIWIWNMIRDPSDGSVKEPPKREISGLPITKQKQEDFERLEKSRAWLKKYYEDRRG
jgi:hypothetical protein